MRKRANRVWTEKEDAFLLKNAGVLSEGYMGTVLGRTEGAVGQRLYLLRLRMDALGEPCVEDRKAENQYSDDEDKNLMMWFVAQAYDEGHAVIIPALGATFQMYRPDHDDYIQSIAQEGKK